jgi:hypothetical protein
MAAVAAPAGARLVSGDLLADPIKLGGAPSQSASMNVWGVGTVAREWFGRGVDN